MNLLPARLLCPLPLHQCPRMWPCLKSSSSLPACVHSSATRMQTQVVRMMALWNTTPTILWLPAPMACLRQQPATSNQRKQGRHWNGCDVCNRSLTLASAGQEPEQ
jgi:hypothetical protein